MKNHFAILSLPLRVVPPLMALFVAGCGGQAPQDAAPTSDATPTSSPSSSAVTPVTPTPAGWMRLEPPGEVFSIVVPKGAKEQASPPAGTRSWRASGQTTIYSVSSSTPTADQSKKFEANVETVLDTIARNTEKGYTLESIKPITVQGHPGRDVRGSDKGLRNRAHILYTKDHLYRLIVVTSAKKLDPDTEAFFSSFKLTSQGKQEAKRDGKE